MTSRATRSTNARRGGEGRQQTPRGNTLSGLRARTQAALRHPNAQEKIPALDIQDTDVWIATLKERLQLTHIRSLYSAVL